MLSYRQLSATSVISSQRFHPNIMRGSALSYTLYTMIYLIFRKEQLMSTSMCLNGRQTSLLNSVNSDLITTTIHIRFFYDNKAKLEQEFKDS